MEGKLFVLAWFLFTRENVIKFFQIIFRFILFLRVIMDRISTEHDPVLKQIDPEMLNGFSSSSQTIDFSSNFTRTNASSKHCENRLSLSEILSNIRSCRLQCFQPRLLNLQDSDSEECTSRKSGQTVNNKRVSAASVALLNTSKNGISGKLSLCSEYSLLFFSP